VTEFQEAAAAPAGAAPRRDAIRAEVASIAWWVLVGTASGAIAGFLVGGIGGRLAMLLLRLTSSDIVIGVTSDDGFEIGVVSTQTANLLLLTTVLGAANGALYAALRETIPIRLRLPLWAGFAALAGGANFVHEDGVDFTLVSPAVLAIALFVALPGVAAALVVLLVERWNREPAWRDRRLVAIVVGASLASTFALVPAALLAAVAFFVRSMGVRERFVRAGRVVVPLGLVVLSLVSGIALVITSARILR